MLEKIKKNATLLFYLSLGVLTLPIYVEIVEENFNLGLSMGPDNFFLIIFVGVFSYYLALLVHELGHTIVGRIFGFKFYAIMVGPIQVSKTENRAIKFQLIKGQLFGGLSALYIKDPKYLKDFRLRHFAYTVGGYLFNIIFVFVLFFLMKLDFDVKWMHAMLGISIYFNLSVIVFDLVTTSEESDVFSLYHIIKKSNIDFISSLIFYFSSGMRPKDISFNEVSLSFSEKKWALFSIFYQYLHDLDRGDYVSALKKMDELETEWSSDATKALFDDEFALQLKLEMLFACYLSQDIEKAHVIYEMLVKDYGMYYDLSKPRAMASYEMLVSGNSDNAQKIYERYYENHEMYDVPYNKGFILFEEDLAVRLNFIKPIE